MKRIEIEIWSDIACPWCYVGKRRMEAALRSLPRRDAVVLTWRSFELDPTAPRRKDPGLPYDELLARKYGTSKERGAEMIRTMTAAAAADGLELRFDRIQPGNTFDAHRLIHLAARHGKGDAASERLFAAYLTEGEPIGDREVLARLGGEIGLDSAEVAATLAGSAFEQEVRADEAAASAQGIRAVPAFRIAGRHRLAGAQPAETILAALTRAMEDA